MGWGWLKPVAKIASVAAAPFTGGASLSALPAIDALGSIGAATGAASQAQASNRGTQFGGQLDLMKLLMDRDQQYQDMQIAREKEGRAGSGDAFRQLMAAQRVLSPRQGPSISGYTRAQPTDAARQGADALTREVMARLEGGNPLAQVTNRPVTNNDAGFRVDPNLLKAGKMESLLGLLSPALSFLGRPKTEAKA